MFPKAVIFDLDGTLVDNNSFHIKAWQAFYDKIGKTFSLEEYMQHINGRVNNEIFNYVFNTTLTPREVAAYSEEKETMYRKLYQPFIKPVNGLVYFLDELAKVGIPLAMATSGLPPNINFMFDNVPIKKYFKNIVDASQVKKGKPDPEIFLKAAHSINANPSHCIAFEDSVAGIRSAKTAGMVVVALTTTHASGYLKEADIIIKDYDEISLAKLRQLKKIKI